MRVFRRRFGGGSLLGHGRDRSIGRRRASIGHLDLRRLSVVGCGGEAFRGLDELNYDVAPQQRAADLRDFVAIQLDLAVDLGGDDHAALIGETHGGHAADQNAAFADRRAVRHARSLVEVDVYGVAAAH